MGTKKSHSEEKRRTGLLEFAQTLDAFIRDLPVGIRVVGNIRLFIRRTAGQFTHVVATVREQGLLTCQLHPILRERIADGLGLEMRNAPRSLVLVIPMANVEDLAKPVTHIAVLLEPLRKRLDLRDSLSKIRSKIVNLQHLRTQPREQCIAGRRTQRLHAVRPLKQCPRRRDAINIRRLRKLVAETADRWFQVVHGHEKHIWLCRLGKRHGSPRNQNRCQEYFHGSEPSKRQTMNQPPEQIGYPHFSQASM